jgi:chaperone modulatory protein CbpM
MALVEEGIVEPVVGNQRPSRFSETTLPRVVRALRLQRDLELNLAGVAFALDLIDEIENLRKRLQRMDL